MGENNDSKKDNKSSKDNNINDLPNKKIKIGAI
jgi:hypothetical protein